MSLKTPLKIRKFQRKLYTKAKQEPSYRFYRGGDLRGLCENSVGKPDAGNRHVRFDERGRETGRTGIAPFLDSTDFSPPTRTRQNYFHSFAPEPESSRSRALRSFLPSSCRAR